MMKNKFIHALFSLCFCAALILSCSCTKDDPGNGGGKNPPVEPETFQRLQSDLKFRSTILDRDIYYTIYLPNNYDTNTDKRYPVVYLCHGYGDNNNSWSKSREAVQALEYAGMEDMIYVYPRGYNYYWSNKYDGTFNHMDMFVNELIPHIDATYRTIADKQHRSITGYSMGGWGAMVIPMKHPEMFCASAPLSISIRTDDMYMYESQSGWDGQWGSIFGGYGKQGQDRITSYYRSCCPYYQFTEANRERLSKVKWFITCGDDEARLLIANDSLHVVMRKAGYEHEYRVGDGAHTGAYWKNALMEVLPMFAYYMNGGDKWQGQNMGKPAFNDVVPASDGSVASPEYTEKGTGRMVYFFHEGMNEQTIKDCMGLVNAGGKGNQFILLPCDLTSKTIAEWKQYWGAKYQNTTERAVAFGLAGRKLFAARDGFYKTGYIQASVAEGLDVSTPVALTLAKDEKIVFACTDNCTWYYDMNRLYAACKEKKPNDRSEYQNKADYQYRVIKGSNDADLDILRCLDQIKTYLIY